MKKKIGILKSKIKRILRKRKRNIKKKFMKKYYSDLGKKKFKLP